MCVSSEEWITFNTRITKLVTSQEIKTKSGDINSVKNTIAGSPPWPLKVVNICQEGASNTKRHSTTSKLKQSFLSHMIMHSNSKHRWIKVQRWCLVWIDPWIKSLV